MPVLTGNSIVESIFLLNSHSSSSLACAENCLSVGGVVQVDLCVELRHVHVHGAVASQSAQKTIRQASPLLRTNSVKLTSSDSGSNHCRKIDGTRVQTTEQSGQLELPDALMVVMADE
jgi:hypothetical protein